MRRLAYFAGDGQWIKPGCGAAIDQPVSIVEALVDPGIVGPEFPSRRGIKRNDAVKGCREIKLSVDQNRSGLKAAPPSSVMTGRDVARMVRSTLP